MKGSSGVRRLPRYRFGEFELDPASRELMRNGERVALPPKSFECLAYLVAHRDRAVGRDELIAAVWGRVELADTVVAQTLLRARKAINDTGERQSTVRTVPRFGYRWVAPVQEALEADTAPGETAPLDVARVEDASDAPAQAHPVEADTTASTAIAPQSSARGPRTSRVWLAAIAAVAALAIVATWLWSGHPSGTPPPVSAGAQQDVVLVLPVAVSPDDNENAWVRLGAMDYVASRLRRGGLAVLPSDQALRLSTQLEEANGTGPTALRKVQSASGARWIVSAEARRDRHGWRMRLILRDADRQDIIDAQGTTALTAAAAASDAWLRRLHRRADGGESMPNPLTERVQQVDAEILAGRLAVARRLIEGAPTRERGDPGLQVRAGQLEYRAGRIDEAALIFQQLLERQPIMPADIRAKALMGEGAVEIRRGNFPDAEARYTQALMALDAGAGSADDPAAIGNAYNGRGVARVQQGRMEAAVQDMGMARIAMQRSGNLIEAASVGSNLGQIETNRGHYAQALQEFDNASAVFARFDVRDYLAATLMSKAETQLKLVQPADAAASIQRAEGLVRSLEDPELTTRIGLVRARVLLANGRLREAEQGIASLRALEPEQSQELQELTLRLQWAKHARADAGALARRLPDPIHPVLGSLMLVAVQAAVGNHDADTARRWLSRAPGPVAGRTESSTEWDLARALMAGSQAHDDNALQAARRAMIRAEHEGSPDERVQAGLVQARLLLAQGHRDAAAAVLGDLDAFAATDYRVAWATLALYRALGDPAMTAAALVRVRALRGEQDLAVEPLL